MWPTKKKDISIADKRKDVVAMVWKDFQQAVVQGDGFRAAKKLGVLEFLGVRDLAFFYGLVHQLLGKESIAASYFQEVAPGCSEYSTAQLQLAVYYSSIGEFEKLQEVLLKPSMKASSVQKMAFRLQCLFWTNPALIDDIRKKYFPSQYQAIDNQSFKENPECAYTVCLLLANTLVAIGEIVNQAAIYQQSSVEPVDWEKDPNFGNYLLRYNQLTYILSHSTCIPLLSSLSGEISLDDLALTNKSWNDKIQILVRTNYRQQVMQAIVNICNPQIHSSISQYTVVEHLLDQVSRIEPSVIAQVVDQYYDAIDRAYHEGKSSAAQYLGYVNSEILAYGSDPYKLKVRIDNTIGKDPQALTRANTIKACKSMTRKGFEALSSAEMMFERIDPNTSGISDYSTLSLQFFRIIEIEMNEKLIKPLLGIVDFSILRALNKQEYANSEQNDRTKNNRDALAKCIDNLEVLLNTKKTLEIGKIQTMLHLSTAWYMKNNLCVQKLHGYISQCLTADGIQAFQSRKMLSIIDASQRDKYRNPGAHTGYLPYSVASESRRFVLTNLPLLESWFK